MDENPSTKSTRHVKANVNTWEENQDHQNNSNKLIHVSVNDLHLHNIYMWYIWLLVFTHTKLVSSHHCHSYYKFIKQFACLSPQFLYRSPSLSKPKSRSWLPSSILQQTILNPSRINFFQIASSPMCLITCLNDSLWFSNLLTHKLTQINKMPTSHPYNLFYVFLAISATWQTMNLDFHHLYSLFNS